VLSCLRCECCAPDGRPLGACRFFFKPSHAAGRAPPQRRGRSSSVASTQGPLCGPFFSAERETMPPTPDQARAGYHATWDRAVIDAKVKPAALAVAKKILANRAHYDPVTARTGVPVTFIGPAHNRESSLRFNAHLHCGDPLTARTVHVPKGRPK